MDMAIVFVATFIGLFVRQEATKLKFNPYLCVYFAAIAASVIAGLAFKLNLDDKTTNMHSQPLFCF